MPGHIGTTAATLMPVALTLTTYFRKTFRATLIKSPLTVRRRSLAVGSGEILTDTVSSALAGMATPDICSSVSLCCS